MSFDLKDSDVVCEEARIKLAYQTKKPIGYYSLFDPGNLFLVQERERSLVKRLRKHGCASLADMHVLDVGCGSGYWLRDFIKWGVSPSNLTGVELLGERLSSAARLCPSEVALHRMNGATLEFPDESFDLVLQSVVFTSVLDGKIRHRMAEEMLRVVKKTGFIIWYDFFVDNPWNQNVRGVRKAEIARLFPNCSVELERVSLVLPLARFLAPWSWLVCHLLSRLRLLNTHYLGLIQKK
ncbi:MAG: class I SAM-dependent methyltransferase [Nitrospira sp.]|nr:class I SAM-dependent methyltransferase [Nitrospira sp.]